MSRYVLDMYLKYCTLFGIQTEGMSSHSQRHEAQRSEYQTPRVSCFPRAKTKTSQAQVLVSTSPILGNRIF